jgi:hypothetical protein
MPFDPNNLHDLQFSTEKQIMDRKSARIAPRSEKSAKSPD